MNAAVLLETLRENLAIRFAPRTNKLASDEPDDNPTARALRPRCRRSRCTRRNGVRKQFVFVS